MSPARSRKHVQLLDLEVRAVVLALVVSLERSKLTIERMDESSIIAIETGVPNKKYRIDVSRLEEP